MTYRDFFRSIAGFYPHPYQERIAEQIAAGRSLILRVPTGAGKTWAAVAPFLYSLQGGRPIADRLLYALPLRSLATSAHAAVRAGMERDFKQVSDLGSGREYGTKRRYCSLQIGSQKDDPFFESDVIFTTIDQLLSGYLFMPVSLPDRIGNINAGALVGSLVVLDEIHQLDADVALGTAVEMFDRLRGPGQAVTSTPLCQFVLMTATMSDDAVQRLANRLGADVPPIGDDEIRSLPSQRTKRRVWRWRDEPITAARITEEHDGGRTIVLINSVARAQDLFLEIEKSYGNDPRKPELKLLHSRFYPEDRKSIEDGLPEYFGPKATKSNIILVTTQVIEAGLDFSADSLHTELAPMNTLVQRAGRTARYEERPNGVVTVYETLGLGPYTDKRTLVDATRDVLRSLPLEGSEVDFVREREWVRDVHADTERRELENESTFHRREAVGEAMDQGQRGLLKSLVRDVNSIGIAITEKPEELFEARGWPRLLSLGRFSLSPLTKCFDNLKPAQWVAKGAEEETSDEGPGVSLKWTELPAGKLRRQWLLAIHPDFASYCPRLGLRLGVGGPAPEYSPVESARGQAYEYRFEPWTVHSERTVRQARTMQPQYACAAEALARKYDVSREMVQRLVDLTCALHDTGKLSLEWQQVAWHWQEEKDKRARAAGRSVPARPRVPLAHTWYEPELDRVFRRRREYQFPHHAVESAFAVWNGVFDLLAESGEDWARIAAACAVTAMARHHGPRTRECGTFHFDDSAALECAAKAAGIERRLDLQACRNQMESQTFPDELLRFSGDRDFKAWPAFVFLVRRLRLADQMATARE